MNGDDLEYLAAERFKRILGPAATPTRVPGLPADKDEGLILAAIGLPPGSPANIHMTMADVRERLEDERERNVAKAGPNAVRIVIPRDQRSARDLFDEGRRTALTTFELPKAEQHLERIGIDTKRIIQRLPFSNFFIREPFTFHGDGAEAGFARGVVVDGVEELLVNRIDDTAIALVGHLTWLNHPRGGRVSRFIIWTGDADEDGSSITVLNRLVNTLYERKHRFVDEPISRQVRKSEGRPAQYRSYIVVPRTDVRYVSAQRSSDIMKRMKALHAVRGHARTYRAERFVNVRGTTQWIDPHMRGTGDALQIKDYRVK